MLVTALELELLPPWYPSPHDPDAWALVVRCIQAIHKSKQRLTCSGLSHAGLPLLMLTLTAVLFDICYHFCPCLKESIPCSIILIIYLSEYLATLAVPHLPISTSSSPSLYALLAMAHLPLLALLQRIIPLHSLSLEGTTSWEIFLGTPPSWRSVTGSEEGVDLNSPEGNCRGAAHAFSLYSAPCSHANGDKPTVFGLLTPS